VGLVWEVSHKTTWVAEDYSPTTMLLSHLTIREPVCPVCLVVVMLQEVLVHCSTNHNPLSQVEEVSLAELPILNPLVEACLEVNHLQQLKEAASLDQIRLSLLQMEEVDYSQAYNQLMLQMEVF